MARVATRVYAASSNMLKPGEEGEPNARSAAFLWWWNNHYTEVAAAEREYQRLNEIMKWALILSRMSTEEFDRLSFLASTTVTRSHWFPTWASRNPQLTFKAWQAVKFMPRGYRKTTTEALPLLQSRIEGGRAISGGVSLPSRRMLSERPALSDATDVLLRRSTVMQETSTGSGRLLKSFDGLTYELKAGASQAERLIVANPRPAARLRSADLEVRNEGFNAVLTSQADGLSLRMSRGTTRVGDFSVRRVGNGFETAFHNHEMERARMLLRVVDDATARNADVAAEMAKVPGVQQVTPAGDAVYVKLPSVEGRWLKVTPEGEPTVAMGEGVDLRYASLGHDHGRRWTSAWVDDAVVRANLASAEYVRLPPSRSPLDGIVAVPGIRGPPTGATTMEVTVGSRKVSAWRDNDGSTYIPGKSADEMWETAAAIRVNQARGLPPTLKQIRASMQTGDFDAVARTLANHPGDATEILNAYRTTSLERAKSLIAEARPREAAAELEATARLFPDDSEIQLTRAIGLIGDQRGQSGMNVLGEGLRRGGADAAPRLHDAARRLAGASGAEREVGNLTVTLHGAELRAHLEGQEAVKAAVAVRPDRTGRLRMEVRLLDWKAAATPQRAVSGRPVYVEVGADFDPALGVRQSVDQLISDGTLVNKLTSWEIVSASPETIVDVKTGARYARVGRAAGGGNSGRALARRDCQQVTAPGVSPDCGDDLYLVRRTAVGAN
jgi:hypothetical protein